MFENLKEFSMWLGKVSDFTDAFPLLLLILANKRTGFVRLLLANFTLIFALKMITVYMSTQRLNNMPLYHLMSVVELIFLTLFYGDILTFKKKSVLLILVPALLFNIFSSLYLQNIYEWNTYSQTLNNFLFMFFGLFFFYHLYKKEETTDVFRSPLFFINTSFLFYFSATFFLFSMGGYFFSADKNGVSFLDNTWTVSAISNIIKNIIISFGLVILLRGKENKTV